MFKTLELKKKIVRNERGAYLWKVGNGYKMSRIAKQLLGIPVDAVGKLTIAFDEDTNILGICKGTDEEYNCSVSKSNTITNTGIMMYLEGIGTTFKLSDTKNAEGYYIMTVVNTVTTDENIEETILEEELV